MKMVKVDLGLAEVNGGMKGDPERVAKIVGDRTYYLGNGGLRPDRFPKMDSWKEGIYQRKLVVINFPCNKVLLNNTGAYILGEPELEGYELGSFPELMSDKFWESLEAVWGQGIGYVSAPAPEALWLHSDGVCSAPYVYCYPDFSCLYACWVGFDLRAYDGFLLSRKVEAELES